MKVNTTTWQEREPKFYQQNDLKTYETADYNQPYIAGVFNKTQLLSVGEFVLGNVNNLSLLRFNLWGDCISFGCVKRMISSLFNNVV